jgi:hypothetical protein
VRHRNVPFGDRVLWNRTCAASLPDAMAILLILASRGLFTRNEGLASAAKPRGANDGGNNRQLRHACPAGLGVDSALIGIH